MRAKPATDDSRIFDLAVARPERRVIAFESMCLRTPPLDFDPGTRAVSEIAIGVFGE